MKIEQKRSIKESWVIPPIFKALPPSMAVVILFLKHTIADQPILNIPTLTIGQELK